MIQMIAQIAMPAFATEVRSLEVIEVEKIAWGEGFVVAD
jgi:hypothetical protein